MEYMGYVDWVNLAQEMFQLAILYEQDNELLASIEGMEFLNQLSNC
jgi:hypothetical protein